MREMSQSTAVLPFRYPIDAFRHADPRFYVGMDIVIPLIRRNDSTILPEGALIIPAVQQSEMVTLRQGHLMQSLPIIEETRVRHHVPGRI